VVCIQRNTKKIILNTSVFSGLTGRRGVNLAQVAVGSTHSPIQIVQGDSFLGYKAARAWSWLLICIQYWD